MAKKEWFKSHGSMQGQNPTDSLEKICHHKIPPKNKLHRLQKENFSSRALLIGNIKEF